MKPKYITPDNYQQFKPSELVHSFISDIEVAERIGKPMDLMHWKGADKCLPCLGGMAAMNWKIAVDFSKKHRSIGTLIADLGDSIRLGLSIQGELKSLYPYLSFSFLGVDGPQGTTMFFSDIKTKPQFKDLKHQVMLYVKELEKHGL